MKNPVIEFAEGPVEYPVIDARKYKRITGKLPFAGNGPTLRPVCPTNFVGRDCDGYDMDYVTCYLPETIEAEMDKAYDWLDGPGRWYPMSAKNLRDYHRENAEEDRERNMRRGW